MHNKNKIFNYFLPQLKLIDLNEKCKFKANWIIISTTIIIEYRAELCALWAIRYFICVCVWYVLKRIKLCLQVDALQERQRWRFILSEKEVIWTPFICSQRNSCTSTPVFMNHDATNCCLYFTPVSAKSFRCLWSRVSCVGQ